jgi:hypothetical protein
MLQITNGYILYTERSNTKKMCFYKEEKKVTLYINNGEVRLHFEVQRSVTHINSKVNLLP